MKTKINILSIIIFFSLNATGQIKVGSTGYVGIGTSVTPAYPLVLITNTTYGNTGINAGYYYNRVTIDPISNNGGDLGLNTNWNTLHVTQIYSSNQIQPSDEKLKQNIKSLDSALIKINKLKGLKYDFKTSAFSGRSDTFKSIAISSRFMKNQIGFMAQDVQKVFPEIVVFDSLRMEYGIKYTSLIPYIIEALKELSSEVDSIRKLIPGKKSSLKSASITDNLVNSEIKSPAWLGQNSPNPFNQNTSISYYLPEITKNAAIYIYNMEGNQVKVIPVYSNGNGSVTIYGNELKPGMYLYSLIADGKEIDTKRMILTE
jgi:hypothetical protein